MATSTARTRARTSAVPRATAAKAAPVAPKRRGAAVKKAAIRPVPTPRGAVKAAKAPAPKVAVVSPSPAPKTVSAPPAMPQSPAFSHTAPAPRPESRVVPKGTYVPVVNIPPLPPPKPITLKVGDKAVHPSHGLGEVVAIEHRVLGGTAGDFYVIRILDNGMRVMVPVATAPQAGLRCVMSAKEADAVIDTMRAREVAVDLQPWSRRFRAYTEMIKSGSPHEVAKVLRDMYRLKFDKDLSFGERRLLDQAKSLLMKELSVAKKMTEEALQEQIAEIFRA